MGRVKKSLCDGEKGEGEKCCLLGRGRKEGRRDEYGRLSVMGREGKERNGVSWGEEANL